MDTSLNLRTGELIEVLSKSEILGTLDEAGRYENLPFMPEMFQYCGKRFGVGKRAHKTCDFVTNTGIRSIDDAVHLEDLRCDGAAHGNCQARCTIYWKEAWLKRIPASSRPSRPVEDGRCTEEAVRAACTTTSSGESDPIYSCQATLLPAFTRPLQWWNVGQYVEDYRSGNETLARMLPTFLYRGYDNLINLGIGLGPILRWVYDRFQRLRGGLAYPGRSGEIALGAPTPSGSLDLQVGEVVRVKSYAEILKTLDTSSKNRGMAFSAEMVPYCDKVFRVSSRVTQIVDEKTGKLLRFKNPCIILEGAVCQARYNRNMIFCPRATYAYWREIWLERVTDSTKEAARMDGGKAEGARQDLCQLQ